MQDNVLSFFKEFFEQKRLQAKVTKIRPKSPQDGAKRGISTDLLFLQAVSKAHDGSIGTHCNVTSAIYYSEQFTPCR